MTVPLSPRGPLRRANTWPSCRPVKEAVGAVVSCTVSGVPSGVCDGICVPQLPSAPEVTHATAAVRARAGFETAIVTGPPPLSVSCAVPSAAVVRLWPPAVTVASSAGSGVVLVLLATGSYAVVNSSTLTVNG